MRPDAAQHRPDPAYLRKLVRATGKDQTELADELGIPRRTLVAYLSRASGRRAPYLLQFVLEYLARQQVSRLCSFDAEGRN